MTDISAAATSAREAARTPTGQFGEQEHTAPDISLTAAAAPPVMWTADGDFGALHIAIGTNPWIQVDGKPVNLMELDGTGEVDSDVCDGCAQGDFAGIALAMDSEDGIQMCDGCQKFEGDLEAAQAAADVLTLRTGRKHTVWFEPEEATPNPATPIKNADPRYVPGISEHDDDMTDAEWVEAMGSADADDSQVAGDLLAKAPEPFVFDRNYDNHEQVRPFMDEFNRVHDEITAAGKYPYNDSFKGRVPSLATTDSKHEDTAIYLMQSLRSIDETRVKLDAFADAGGRDIDTDDVPVGATLRGTLVLHGFYVGGTGHRVIEGVRLRRTRSGRQLEYVEKGKRNGSIIGSGNVMFRED